MNASSYHHGDLRRALLEQAVPLIQEVGPAAASLRELARRTGVSHAAPTHHFGDKTGLLTALATQGFDLLAARLTETARETGSFREVGVAYVSFALENPAHFTTMFRADLLHGDDPELAAARDRAGAPLRGSMTDSPGDRPGADPAVTAIAAWSLVHGFASLWASGAIPDKSRAGGSPESLARAITGVLFGANG